MSGRQTGPSVATPPGADELLRRLDLRSAFTCVAELTGRWGLDFDRREDESWFHIVLSGQAVLVKPTGEHQAILAGDVVVLPHGHPHQLLDAADGEATLRVERANLDGRGECPALRHGTAGRTTALICGATRFTNPTARMLVELLPPVVIAGSSPGVATWSPTIFAVLSAEALAAKPGSETITARLADVLVVAALRSWIASDGTTNNGWLAASRDPVIGPTLATIHREPERDWTVASLAGETSLSRSAFSARFTNMVGVSAKRYLTEWRMRLACELLADPNLDIRDVAHRVGYRSEPAFSRAFRRVTGVAPGAARHRS